MNRSPEEEDPTHLKHVIFVDQGKRNVARPFVTLASHPIASVFGAKIIPRSN
jgi:hypothetical protein